MKKKAIFLVVAAVLVLLLVSCEKEKKENPVSAVSLETEIKTFSVLIFVPGVVAGSPSYEALVQGAENAAETEPGIQLKVFEAGFNQAEWKEKLVGLIAGGNYDLVLTTNPAMPTLCAEVGRSFPDQKFIIHDAYFPGNSSIATYFYNQYEQSVYLGYLGALISEEGFAAGKNKRRLGYVLAQEFPVANELMVPGFRDGARMVHPDYTVDLRIVGNWFDANKAAELTGSIIDAGAAVLTQIAGGAGQGVVKTAQDRGAFIVAYDNNQYANAPGTILGSGWLGLGKLTEETVLLALKNDIPYGEAVIVGLKEGYLDFIFDDPGYTDYLSADIRTRFEDFFNKLKTGEITIETPKSIF